jgi:hypothetical protein
MKIKNILLTGLSVLALTSCNDYLDVEAPSAYTEEFVFSQKTEVQRALNGVYAQALANNLYGNAYQRTFILNSDVDMQSSSNNSHQHNSYARFDCDEQGGEINSFWTAAYNLIEYANKFIHSAEKSSLYDKSDNEYMQWIGEAKCLRAMAYHDLVVMFGDVPFTFEPTSTKGSDFVIPIFNRETIQDSLINDLKAISLYMSSSSRTTVERCSKEFAQAMIARIALTAGGYSLRPNKNDAKNYGTMQRPDNWRNYYKTAQDYADSVISAGTHSLTAEYHEVFVNECNYQVVNDDDPIFEIPFAKESTGNTGYIQGPTYSSNEGKTIGNWGATSGNGRLNAFYRFLFRENDKRREFVNGMWYYAIHTYGDGTQADSVVIRNDYTVHNNKWSKLWTAEGNALGNITTGATGINYPYMRYADVLLMYAETANALNGGPTEKAVTCLQTVHNRAFEDGDPDFITAAQADEEAFQKAVMDERKWEFAGENSRWRDLVRTNTYAEELVWSFLRYHATGYRNAGSPIDLESEINKHDGNLYSISRLPTTIHYHPYYLGDVKPVGFLRFKSQLYGYLLDASRNVTRVYPNQSLQSLRILNAYERAEDPMNSAITSGFNGGYTWLHANFYRWGNQDTGLPNDYCKYSFYGYIRCDESGTVYLVNNGTLSQFPSTVPTSDQLPAVRYILPYPNLAIQRSAGAYQNYYGY